MMADETSNQKNQRDKVVVLHICPTKLSQAPEKTYRKKKGAEIIHAINGFYNSGGGTLILRYNRSPPRGHVKKCVAIIEQKILEILGTVTLSFDIHIEKVPFSSSQAHGEIKIIIETSTKTECIAPIAYNFYLPSNQLVMEVSPFERIEKLRALLMEKIPPVEPIEANAHHRHFVKGEHVSFDESKISQFKHLKDEPAKKTTFANRVVGKSNKFPCCVSAFANYRGGYMYFGIGDDGKIEGESVDETEKQKVKNSIRKAINKMKWPKSAPVGKTEDKRWKIHFEPVRDSENNIIQKLYVVVVFVAQCRGGVFTEEPECYEIIDNTVQKVDFVSWKKRNDLPLTEEGTCSVSVTCDSFYEKLTNLLNNNCNGDELEKASETIQKEYNISENEVKLLFLSKMTSFYARRGEYGLAEECLRDHNKKIQTCCNNQMRFKVMEQLYLSSVVKRCKGEYEESNKILKESLGDLETLPIGIISALVYIQIATVENILAMKTKDPKEKRSLINEAKKNYDIASSYLKHNRGRSITKENYLQKIYINKALLYLGCSLSGDMLDNNDEFINTNEAKRYLLKTQKSILDGYPLCKFRKIQNLLAQACLSYRLYNDDATQQIQHAVNYSTKAVNLAAKCKFAEMQTYAERYKKFFESRFEKQTSE